MRPGRSRGSQLGLRGAGLRFHCASGPVQDPLTRSHVTLLGPCFKTGRVGDRPTRRKPPASYGSGATSGGPRSPDHPGGVRRDSAVPTCGALSRVPREGRRRGLKGLATPRPGDEPLTERLTTGDAPRRATGHLPSSAPQAVALALPSRLRRPSGESQMRLAQRRSRAAERPPLGEALLRFPTCASAAPD